MHEKEKHPQTGGLVGPAVHATETAGAGSNETLEINRASFPVLTEWLRLPPGEFKYRLDELTAFHEVFADRPRVHRAIQAMILLLGELYKNKL